MDLFEFNTSSNDMDKPLAELARPSRFDEVVLSEAETKKLKMVRSQIERTKRVPSLVLWGPPGSGKTTLAKLIAGVAEGRFVEANAVETGAKRLLEICEEAKRSRAYSSEFTVVFVDEIHRLNKAQQDVLLPYVEDATISLVGATTENPLAALNRALMSRMTLFQTERRSQSQAKEIIDRLSRRPEFQWLSKLPPSAVSALITWSNGDLRVLLNLVEQVNQLQMDHSLEELSVEELEELMMKPSGASSQDTNDFYNLLSALIKSIRGTDPDASIYYFSRLLDGGADPKVLARRLVISASEDVGNADPSALAIAVAGLQALESVGLPEAAINLAQVVTYLASAPKSNRSYMALRMAQRCIQETGGLSVPGFLTASLQKSAVPPSSTYRSPHSEPNFYRSETYLPAELKGEIFYRPSCSGQEGAIAKRLNELDPKKFS